MDRKTVTAAIAVGICMLAACSGPPVRHHHGSAFTFAEAAQACKDVAAWFPKAYNSLGSGQQFTPAMVHDQAQAGNSQLGLALMTMDDDDQPGNYTWDMSAPGIPSDYSAIQGICLNTYGIPLPSPSL